MYTALDKNNNLVDINDANKFKLYYCPSCRSKLLVKKGDVRQHHFAHDFNKDCDNWKVEMSEWHREWQKQFPIQCREVPIENHRADICVPNKLVIEFQNSHLSLEDWNERINFYSKNHNLIFVVNAINKKVSIDKGDYLILNNKLENKYSMKNPFTGIPNPDKYNLFFQITDNALIWVTNNINNSWKNFYGCMLLTKSEFIKVAGMIGRNQLSNYTERFLYYKEGYYFENLEKSFKSKFREKIKEVKLEILKVKKATDYLSNNKLKDDLNKVKHDFQDKINYLKKKQQIELENLQLKHKQELEVLCKAQKIEFNNLYKINKEYKNIIFDKSLKVLKDNMELIEDVGFRLDKSILISNEKIHGITEEESLEIDLKNKQYEEKLKEIRRKDRDWSNAMFFAKYKENK